MGYRRLARPRSAPDPDPGVVGAGGRARSRPSPSWCTAVPGVAAVSPWRVCAQPASTRYGTWRVVYWAGVPTSIRAYPTTDGDEPPSPRVPRPPRLLRRVRRPLTFSRCSSRRRSASGDGSAPAGAVARRCRGIGRLGRRRGDTDGTRHRRNAGEWPGGGRAGRGRFRHRRLSTPDVRAIRARARHLPQRVGGRVDQAQWGADRAGPAYGDQQLRHRSQGRHRVHQPQDGDSPRPRDRRDRRDSDPRHPRTPGSLARCRDLPDRPASSSSRTPSSRRPGPRWRCRTRPEACGSMERVKCG